MADDAFRKQQMRELIRRAGVAMLMTIDEHGAHAGRPMLPLMLDDDPHIYFLTHQRTRKVTHVATRPQIGLTLIVEDRYIAVTGVADLSQDPDLIGRLWSPTYRAWFPQGRNERDVTVLRVAVQRLDFWEPPRSRLVRLAQAVHAMVTRRPVDTPMNTLNGL